MRYNDQQHFGGIFELSDTIARLGICEVLEVPTAV